MEIVSYGGWERCARIVSGSVDAIVTLDVGPRVIRLGEIGGRNELHESPTEIGLTGGNAYRSYGGHRLWTAPEDKVRTYQPDNDPVEFEANDDWQIFRPRQDRFGIQKEIRVLPEGGGSFRIEHRITNNGEPIALAPWALTVMATGGVGLVPQAPFLEFPAILTPVRPLVLWSYTNMSDPRFMWGKSVVRMRQDLNRGPIKYGTCVSQGYAAYHNSPNLFIKRFEHDSEATYPDYGCNFETFTRQDMLEVETLGPIREVARGETLSHVERWKLLLNVALPEEDQALGETLAKLALS